MILAFKFNIALFESPTEEIEAAGVVQDDVGKRHGSFDLTKLKVPMAEDDIVNQYVASLILSSIGTECEVVSKPLLLPNLKLSCAQFSPILALFFRKSKSNSGNSLKSNEIDSFLVMQIRQFFDFRL